jgi:hypothetical protein
MADSSSSRQPGAEQALAKVHKLLAMTTSPHVEEARTSAFLACRLIREHGLRVVGQTPPPFPSPSPPWQSTTAAAAATAASRDGFRRIQLRHSGYCRVCGKPIAVGQWAAWARGWGVRHTNCQS